MSGQRNSVGTRVYGGASPAQPWAQRGRVANSTLPAQKPPFRSIAAAQVVADKKTSKGGRRHEVVPVPGGWRVQLVGAPVPQPRKPQRSDPFPPVVAAQLDQRDGSCQRCPATERLFRHHRRAKATGGSKARAHTQCACNGVRLCLSCHLWVHSNPAEARDEGWIVSQAVTLPASIGVKRFTERGIETVWPDCHGSWRQTAGEALERAA